MINYSAIFVGVGKIVFVVTGDAIGLVVDVTIEKLDAAIADDNNIFVVAEFDVDLLLLLPIGRFQNARRRGRGNRRGRGGRHGNGRMAVRGH